MLTGYPSWDVFGQRKIFDAFVVMSDKVLNAKKIVVEYNFSCGLPLPYMDGYKCHGEFGKFFGDSFRSVLGGLDSRGAQ